MTWIAPGPRLPPPPPGERWRRRSQWGIVLSVVLAGHAWLIGPFRSPLGRIPVPSASIQVVTLPTPEPPAPPREAEGAQARETAPAEARPAPPPEHRGLAKPLPDRAIDWSAPRLSAEDLAVEEAKAVREEMARLAAAMPPASAAEPGLVGGAEGDPGKPPPVYRTHVPGAFTLDYRLERGDEAGVGRLAFETDANGSYRAQFYGVTGNKALLDWVSRGGFNAAGVAPQRMVERQRGIEQRAVNFQRDQGVISFSSSTRAIDLFAGAQDRVSVLLQLAAIAQAQPGGLRAGQQIRLQVASARGQVDDWRFDVVGEERLEPAGTPIDTVHLRREPTQPYDQRVEVWLARAAGHLPVGLRFTPVPGRESTAYWLSGRLPVPTVAASAPGNPRP